MFVLRNEKLAGKKLATSAGIVTIDSKGHFSIEDESIASILAKSVGFKKVSGFPVADPVAVPKEEKTVSPKSKKAEKKVEATDTKKENTPLVTEGAKKPVESARKWRKKNDEHAS